MEQRRRPRNKMLRVGTIEFHGGAIDCMIRNMSETGAALDVASPLGIPHNFNLILRPDGIVMPCHIAWCKDRRIGVKFV